ncbi:MAG: hypothetical protein V4752_11345 [Pantoea dispersa]|uniref:hypothetical protein n=1 Tax=Pantoea dispersa TaxID=59814 RepID=UPI00285A329F|nr:hypothetical protein [Pantoea dispersa]MDR6295896.1 hypothetical protein [Pantoea dispersa]
MNEIAIMIILASFKTPKSMFKGFPMRKTLFVVILIGISYKDSRILNCMMNKAYVDIDLLIINRGPIPLRFDKDFIHTLGFYVNNIDIKEFINERPLGELFNEIIEDNHESDRFLFFDADSILGKEYISKLDLYHETDVDLQIPKVRGRLDGKVYYPIINELVPNNDDGLKINLHHSVQSIGLGLVIYRSLVDKFSTKRMSVFDNHFTFNELENGFFKRLDMLRSENINVVIQVVNTLDYALYPSYGMQTKWRFLERLLSIKDHLAIKRSRV